MLLTKENIHNYVSCYLIHKHPQYATHTAQVIAKQWNHKQGEINRNITSMTQESKDTLPCHLALVLKNSTNEVITIRRKRAENSSENVNPAEIENNYKSVSKDNGDFEIVVGDEIVVGHVKLMKADGRSDGTCCISYSLVVPEEFRGLRLGRMLTEEAENYARSLNMAYMYLSTDDKVTFYEHLGYKQCEPVSSLGNNSKRLTDTQVSSLEGLFAKRLNICNPTTCNSWLRKRLVIESNLVEPDSIEVVRTSLKIYLEQLKYDKEELSSFSIFEGVLIQIPWQQQTGPSCGIALLNMVAKYFGNNPQSQQGSLADFENCSRNITLCHCVNSQNSKPPIKDIDCNTTALEIAFKLGISNDGEMFCAYNLACLAQKAHNLNLLVKDIQGKEMSSAEEIIKNITKGFPVLIAYDRCLNDHTPGCFDGRQAHWAGIVGFLQPRPRKSSEKEEQLDHSDENSQEERELNLTLEVASIENPGHKETEDFQNLILICQHGMSKKLFLCTYEDMINSSGQLNQSKSKFYLSAEDLQHLRNKVLFIY